MRAGTNVGSTLLFSVCPSVCPSILFCGDSSVVIFHLVSSEIHIWITFTNTLPNLRMGFSR